MVSNNIMLIICEIPLSRVLPIWSEPAPLPNTNTVNSRYLKIENLKFPVMSNCFLRSRFPYSVHIVWLRLTQIRICKSCVCPHTYKTVKISLPISNFNFCCKMQNDNNSVFTPTMKFAKVGVRVKYTDQFTANYP